LSGLLTFGATYLRPAGAFFGCPPAPSRLGNESIISGFLYENIDMVCYQGAYNAICR